MSTSPKKSTNVRRKSIVDVSPPKPSRRRALSISPHKKQRRSSVARTGGRHSLATLTAFRESLKNTPQTSRNASGRNSPTNKSQKSTPTRGKVTFSEPSKSTSARSTFVMPPKTPKKAPSCSPSKKAANANKAEDSNVQVFVRVRPFLRDPNKVDVFESTENNMLVFHEENCSGVSDRRIPPPATFDKVFDMKSTQEEVFEHTKPFMANILERGFNGTIFAYGQSGTGKTHTMSGSLGNKENWGLLPRIVHQFFDHVSNEEDSIKSDESKPRTEHLIHISVVEIYNEEIRDLFGDPKANLKVRENSQTHAFYVEGLTRRVMTDPNEAIQQIETGMDNRTVTATQFNDVSSRSHCIVNVTLETSEFHKDKTGREKKTVIVSKMNLVDLAGAETAQTKNKEMAKESKAINVSLTNLATVIQALAKKGSGKKSDVFVPYRNSQLTKLLKDSLGGNAKTIMFSCLSPSLDDFNMTASTLRYATSAKKIKNAAVRNVDPKDALIFELNQAVQNLQLEAKKVRFQTRVLRALWSGKRGQASPWAARALQEKQQVVHHHEIGDPIDITINVNSINEEMQQKYDMEHRQLMFLQAKYKQKENKSKIRRKKYKRLQKQKKEELSKLREKFVGEIKETNDKLRDFLG